MTLTDQVIKNIIKRLINGKDYRIEVVALINAEFLQFAIDFFKQVIEAKLSNKDLTVDWYKKTFLNSNLSSTDIAINSGLNKKTIALFFCTPHWEIEGYDITNKIVSPLFQDYFFTDEYKEDLVKSISVEDVIKVIDAI